MMHKFYMTLFYAILCFYILCLIVWQRSNVIRLVFLCCYTNLGVFTCKYVYKECEVFMANKKIVTNSMVLDMLEFDVILGMHCLATYHATSNYLKFNLIGKPSFLVFSD